MDRAEGRVTHHSFSFGGHYDAERLGFGPMVCHDDHLVGAGRGFDTHHHSDLEIVTWVISGALRHVDSTGSTTIVEAGSVAVLSTGPGIDHSEHATETGPCRFIQMWLRPAEGDSAPDFTVTSVPIPTNDLAVVAQPRPDAALSVGRLDGRGSIELPVAARVHAFVATGALLRSSLAAPLVAGDAFLMTDETSHTVTAGVPTDLLVWTFG